MEKSNCTQWRSEFWNSPVFEVNECLVIDSYNHLESRLNFQLFKWVQPITWLITIWIADSKLIFRWIHLLGVHFSDPPCTTNFQLSWLQHHSTHNFQFSWFIDRIKITVTTVWNTEETVDMYWGFDLGRPHRLYNENH